MRPFLAVLCGCVLSLSVHAQGFRQLSTVHDGSGVLSDNTVTLGGVDYRHVSAAGQPGGVFTSTGGDFSNMAGFLQAVDIKRPDLDTDGDGVIDELSLDNDGDGLHDAVEIEGSEFDPTTPTYVNTADTDGDGVIDGEESVAGSNPTDPNSFLQITSIQDMGDAQALSWTARDGKQYRILSAEGQHAHPTNVEAIVTAQGGLAPWFETSGGFTNAGGTDVKTYGIEVLP